MEMLISQSVSKFSKSWDLSGFLICGPTDTEGGGHLSASRSLTKAQTSARLFPS